MKVGIPEFLKGIGKGVETHVPKLESEIVDFQKLLVTRTLKLKKLGIPCKHVIFHQKKTMLFTLLYTHAHAYEHAETYENLYFPDLHCLLPYGD